MKKILILAYDFPPYNSIGAQRPASWLKYFPLNEIDTTIVTRHWSRDVASPIDYIKPSENQKESNEEISELSRVIRAPFNPNYRDKLILKYGFEKKIIFRKAVSYIFSYAKFFIKRFDETYSIYKSAEAYIIKNKPDLIIATAEPFILFKHAQKLSEKYHIPWVADYRDCWSNNISAGKKGIFNSTNSLMLSAIEKCIVKKAALITTPSPSYKLKLKELHADKEIEVIYNGFDISNLKLLRDIKPLSDCFKISYAGIIYKHQQLEMFLEGFRMFVKNKKGLNVKLVFYGIEFYPEMKNRLIKFDENLLPYIETTYRLPYENVMQKLAESHCLLLLTDEGADWLNAKVFDYLALNRPILLVKNDKGILEKIIDETSVGYKASSSEEVRNHLENIYANYFGDKDEMKSSEDINFYSREKQAEIFVAILKANNFFDYNNKTQ